MSELVTPEGELVALAATSGPFECAVAIVGDDPALCVDAVGVKSRALVEALVHELGIGLGVRQRWFRYDTPHQWIGVRRDRATVWLHPEYSRIRGELAVFDARPFQPATDRLERLLFVRMPGELAHASESILDDATSRFGLSGRLRTIHGTLVGHRVVRVAAALADDRFAYLAHYQGPENVTSTFHAVVSSFRPVARTPRRLWLDETGET